MAYAGALCDITNGTATGECLFLNHAPVVLPGVKYMTYYPLRVLWSYNGRLRLHRAPYVLYGVPIYRLCITRVCFGLKQTMVSSCVCVCVCVFFGGATGTLLLSHDLSAETIRSSSAVNFPALTGSMQLDQQDYNLSGHVCQDGVAHVVATRTSKSAHGLQAPYYFTVSGVFALVASRGGHLGLQGWAPSFADLAAARALQAMRSTQALPLQHQAQQHAQALPPLLAKQATPAQAIWAQQTRTPQQQARQQAQLQALQVYIYI